MTARVQLITFVGCPHASAARNAITRAIEDVGLKFHVEEIDSMAATTPQALRQWGSPTILVNGKDVGGESVPTGSCCRLYRHEDGNMRGIPSTSALESALRSASV